MDLIKNNLKCVAQVCLLVIGILASSLNIQCYGAGDFEAPNAASPILCSLEMGKVVDCQSRVEFAKSVINNHSTASGETVTMRTPIPELMELWNRDYAFVVREMELAHAKLPEGASCQSFDVAYECLVPEDEAVVSRMREESATWEEISAFRFGDVARYETCYKQHRRNLSNILFAVRRLNDHVQRDADMMSFGYLNYINRLLAEYLSWGTTSDGAFEDLYDRDSNIYEKHEYPHSFSGSSRSEEYKAYNLKSMIGQTAIINNRVDMHITITHVSKTALIPFDAMIDSLAFDINSQNYAFGFIGVGTNPALTFDGLAADSAGTWQHDVRHVVGMTYNIDEMAQFKELMCNDYQNPSVQYVLYFHFHEAGYQQLSEICKMITETDPGVLPEYIDQKSTKSHVVGDAEYLKKKRDVDGFDNTSAASRLAGYKSFVLEGYELIRPKAQRFLDQRK